MERGFLQLGSPLLLWANLPQSSWHPLPLWLQWSHSTLHPNQLFACNMIGTSLKIVRQLHTRAQCSHASVGLAQARLNYSLSWGLQGIVWVITKHEELTPCSSTQHHFTYYPVSPWLYVPHPAHSHLIAPTPPHSHPHTPPHITPPHTHTPHTITDPTKEEPIEFPVGKDCNLQTKNHRTPLTLSVTMETNHNITYHGHCPRRWA